MSVWHWQWCKRLRNPAASKLEESSCCAGLGLGSDKWDEYSDSVEPSRGGLGGQLAEFRGERIKANV